MQALKDLLGSERGLLALVLIIAATVLAGIGRMTVDQWQTFAMGVFGIYVGGKTITSAAGLLAPKAPPPAS